MKFSIITINLNNKLGLEKTIISVVTQSFKDFEWIIIDGGSSDGSLELIKKNSHLFSFWVSEPDDGIYNAMNKGIRVSKGDYLLFLNSGDFLADKDVLKNVFDSHPIADFVYGNNYERDGSIGISPDHPSFYHLVRSTICHQNIFHSRRLFEQRLYDEHYRIASDWKLIFQGIVCEGATYQKIDVIICGLQEGTSYDSSYLPNERESILKQLYSEVELKAINEYVHLKESQWYSESQYLNSHPRLHRWIKRIIRLHKLVLG